LESKWRDFDARLGAFNDKIEDQKKRLREEIDRRAKALGVELEKMYDRWQEKKPKDRNQLTYEDALQISESMRELRE
jgi:oligoendopeptidase F